MKHLVQGGDNTVVARTTYEGYTPDQESVYVDVTADGASPNPVVFTYTRNAPTEIAIAVEYYNETTGEVMVTDSQNVPVNQTTPISPKPELLANYDVEATNAQPVDVTVDAQGNADKPTVRFTYKNREVAPVPDAVITVYYIDLDDGGAAFNQETKNCPAGQPTTIAPNEALTAGYVAENADPVTVNVDANGVADRTEVTFSYRKEKPAATSATIEINYEDEEGHDVAGFQTKELSNRDTPYTISAEPTDLTAGYELISAPTVEVWVKDGVADPAVVRFVYEKKQQEPTPTPEPEPEPEPVYADVTVQYVDQQGQQVAAAQVHQGLAPGSYDITAAPEGLPEGYTLVDDEATKQVTVFADGSVSMNPVIFVYAAPQPAATPQKAIVTTYYRNEAGENIADPVEVELTQLGMTTAVAPDRARVPAEYDANSAAPVPVEVSELGVPTPGEVVFTFTKAEPADMPIPQGKMINRLGKITMVDTAVRPRPIANNKTAKPVARLAKGTSVYVLREELNEKGESWMRVLYNDGQYFISSQCIKVLSQKESDELMAQYETPITPWTEDQLPAPGTVAGDEPTPTETPTPTEAPTPTAIPDQYAGYALTEGKTALRSAMSMEDNAIQSTLDDLQLVMVSRQEYQEGSSAAWSVVTTLDNQSGYVPDANLRRISDKEAQIYIDKWNSEHATAAPTDVPTATPTPAPYTGYALTNGAVALRTEISSADSTIIRRMEANELVMVTRQSYEQGTNALWSQVTTLDNMPGYVPDGSLKHINNEEAQYYLNLWNQQNATPTPSATPEPTATPNPVSGYAYTVGDDVYFRSLASTMSSIIDVLPRNVVVYVRAQEYVDGVAWHVVQYNKQWGYIRADMLRMMTIDEENAYLNSLSSPEPTLAITPQPYNPDSLSSYGYVSASSVNFRKEASTSSSKLGTLKQYAFCLILGTTENNGSTWYHVNYGGKVGYISGEYFKQMTITELEKFLDSNEYRQGISNNTSSGNTDNTGNTKPNSGGIVSAEDQTVSVWTNPNSGLNVSYEPFDPFATVAPVATGSAQPTATTTIEPLPSESLEPLPSAEVTYPMEETESGSSIVGWIIGIAVVALLGGGVYAYVIYTQNKRKAAQRAAQRRAQAAAQQRGEGRPYARQNGVPGQPGQPRTGTYPNQNGQAQRPGMQGPTAQRSGAQAPTAQRPVNGGQPTAQQPRRPYGVSTAAQNPYSRPATPGNGQATGASEASNAYNRPAGQPSDYGAAFRPQNGGAGGTTTPTQGSTPANGAAPMGRRSAYRASHNAANGQNGTGRPNDNGDFAEDKDNGDF